MESLPLILSTTTGNMAEEGWGYALAARASVSRDRAAARADCLAMGLEPAHERG
jgi:hypothetical protein